MPYTKEDYIRAADHVLAHQSHQCHRDFYELRGAYAEALRRASERPNDKNSISCLLGVKLYDRTGWFKAK